MTYAVKEVFKTLQGEGAQMGRAAVFCRFAGCNLWSGREVDRASSVCTFCDTDFVGMDRNRWRSFFRRRRFGRRDTGGVGQRDDSPLCCAYRR